MSAQSGKETALDGLRVLDIADEKGLYCTKLLADLGADVIKIEKLGGDATRNIGPFWHDIIHPEKSLFFAYLNTNKRGITLNIESVDGQHIFKRLAKGADIIVETYAPGYLASIGLGYSVLKQLNRGLIMTSITGFGQSGPYKDFKSAEMVSTAMGGLMFETGQPDAPPLQSGGLQMCYMTGLPAAIATLQALYYRNRAGEGQQVDVSMQECVAQILETASVLYTYDKVIQWRRGPVIALGGAGPSTIYPCKDGYAFISASTADRWTTFIIWMIEEGMDVGELADPIYEDRDVRSSKREEVDALVSKWAMKHTKAEIFKEGQRRGLPFVPMTTFDEVSEDSHLDGRDYFVEVEHPEMGSFKYPGTPYKLSKTPWSVRRPSPLIGQHNEEIYAELGLSKEDLVILKGAGVI